MYVCGLDVGGTKLLGLVFDSADPLGWHAERRIPTPRDLTDLADAADAVLAELTAELRARAPGADLAGVGVGIAGLVDRSGVLRLGPNLPGMVDAPVRSAIRERLGRPVAVANDATAATWAEQRAGAGVGVDELVLVTLGTGIGAGLVTNGELVLGRHGFAGEAGHMIVDPRGPLCPCGQRGCWERYASGSGLGRLGREAAEAGRLQRLVAEVGDDPEGVRGVDVTAAALAGDPEAVAVLEQFAWWVALGLVNLTNLVDPELIIIGGGLVAAGDLLLDAVRRAYRELLFAPGHRDPARIELAVLGDRAGAIGAGLLGLAAG